MARTKIHDLEAALGLHRKQKNTDQSTLAIIAAKTPGALMEHDLDERKKIIDLQKIEIRRLRNQIEEFGLMSRTASGNMRLPPVEQSA